MADSGFDQQLDRIAPALVWDEQRMAAIAREALDWLPVGNETYLRQMPETLLEAAINNLEWLQVIDILRVHVERDRLVAAALRLNDTRITMDLARNEKLPHHWMEVLTDHPDWHVRGTIYQHRRCTVELLRKGLADPHPSVRQAARTHPRAAKLFDQSEHWQEAILNQRCSTQVLAQAAEQVLGAEQINAQHVRTILEHPNTDADTLQRLARLGTQYAAIAAPHPHCPGDIVEQVFEKAGPDFRTRLLVHPNLPRHCWEPLLDSSSGARTLATRSDLTTADIDRLMAKHLDVPWLYANPNCSLGHITTLFERRTIDDKAKEHAATNPNCPREYVMRIVAVLDRVAISRAALIIKNPVLDQQDLLPLIHSSWAGINKDPRTRALRSRLPEHVWALAKMAR